MFQLNRHNQNIKSIYAITLRKAFCHILIICISVFFLTCQNPSADEQSIAQKWNETILDAIRLDVPHPPAHARNLWHLSLAMYDAWAVYDSEALGYLTTEKITGLTLEKIEKSRREAISYAAYRILTNRYALSAHVSRTLAMLDEVMIGLGYDIDNDSTEGNSPSAIGNRIAETVIDFGNNDGSNQSGFYADSTYSSVNSPLLVAFPGNDMTDPNRWQPLSLNVSFTQNGIPLPNGSQSFVGARWIGVTPFALTRENSDSPYINPGAPPMLSTETDEEFKNQMLDVIEKSSLLSPEFEATLDISPGAYGNNSLGANDGTGHAINPATGSPYESQTVKLGDFARVLAEYWADGPNSETPPGHWNSIANSISDHESQEFRFEGSGSPMNRLEWDVKLYFALNGALHDAAVNAWSLKRFYDSVRPISAIRYMGTLGQCTDPSAPSYNVEGLPLQDDLVEIITEDTWPEGRHTGIICCENDLGMPSPCVDDDGNAGAEVSCVGELAVYSWAGEPDNKTTDFGGVSWIRAMEWIPYQLDTFVSPAFPAFISGHSTFSRAAAEVLTAFTGSAFFPGGLGVYLAPQNDTLNFEIGPSNNIQLQWATYYDAADQAGQSRIYGGIHIVADDFNGRIVGSDIGQAAFAKAKTHFNP